MEGPNKIMIEIQKPSIECVEISPDGKYGKLVVEPLERGFGTTIGNSLRRVLLSSLPGAAVTGVKIDGVQHEFTSIDGVKEDVTDIILNLKGLAVKMHCNEPRTIYLRAKGECVLTGADIECDADVEIMNPEIHIATLNSDADLNMEITVAKGRGYAVADKNKTPNQPIGVIPMDSIFTPINKVNYFIENTRVGQVTDYDKLTMEIWTNGTIAPDEAVAFAAKIISDHLDLFMQFIDNVKNVEIMVKKEDEKKEKILEMSIEELDLSVRSSNCLKRAGINLVDDLVKKTEDEMMRVRNLGRKSLDEVTQKLASLGLSLKQRED